MSRKWYKRKFVWVKTYNYAPLVKASIHCESKMNPTKHRCKCCQPKDEKKNAHESVRKRRLGNQNGDHLVDLSESNILETQVTYSLEGCSLNFISYK